MGMWQPEPVVTPKPRYKNTVVCPSCHAEYNPKTRWVWVTYMAGSTANDYKKLGDVPKDVCPGCLTKPK